MLKRLTNSPAAEPTMPAAYGTAKEAERKFDWHASLVFDSPELDRRLMLLAGLAGSGRADVGHVVFDVGGATGFHRAQIAPVLGDAGALDWVVIETEAFCDAASRRELLGVSFFVSLAAAMQAGKAPTCIYSNSGLQYLADPLAALAEMIASGAGAIVFERVPFGLGSQTIYCEQLVTHASGERATARMAIAPVAEVMRRLERAGFQVALYCTRRAAFRHGHELIDLYSLLAIRAAYGGK